jgi:hypothetical protein
MKSGLIYAIVILALGWAPAAGAAQTTPRICFTEVPDCVEGRFAEYWRQHGGLAIFGFPLGPARREQIGGASYLVQIFERNRFELHPENSRPYDVLLGRLGDERLRKAGRDWQSFPKISGPPGDLCLFARQTGHAVCGDFFTYYRTHGLEFDGRRGYSEAESIALFGLPLSEPRQETAADGKPYMTQWFERARFEYHPENPEPYKVLLGRLGAELTPCADIPPSVNATITPNCFKGGARVTVRATGFRAGEQVSYNIKAPPGVVVPQVLATGSLVASAGGVVEIANTLPTVLPPGLYSITFEGAQSGNKGVINFKILEN